VRLAVSAQGCKFGQPENGCLDVQGSGEFATVLTCVYARDQDSLTALGFGIAVVTTIIYPGDRAWVSSVVFGLVGVAMMKALFQIVGLGW
jgi:hypothetical protein